MHKRYIQSLQCRFLDPHKEEEALQMLAGILPKRTARRMSKLGILLHAVLEGMPLEMGTTLVYGTSFSETNALQTYLESFPFASPTAFQTSIHPGGIEQALILRQQDVGAFVPMGGATDLLPNLLKCAFASTSPAVLVCGGEERGGWLLDYNVAYPTSFAFGMLLSESPDGRVGSVSWDASTPVAKTSELSMEQLVQRLVDRQDTTVGGQDHGLFHFCMA